MHGFQPAFPEPPDFLKRGAVVGGRFEVAKALGKGGMGVVYEARDRQTNERLALKTILPMHLTNKRAVKRFIREINTARRLHHPNIVALKNDGQFVDRTGAQGPLLFFTMEFLEGVSLRSVLMERGQLEIEEAVAILKQLCDALEHAHEVMIHRDLSPENVMLLKNGQVKLLDFGLARMVDSRTMTATGKALGKAHYMSPEQRKDSAHVDSRTDLFALGVMFYEMLTAKFPVGYQRIADIRPGLPEECDQLVARCLVPLDRRIETAREFREGLDGCLEAARRASERVLQDAASAGPQLERHVLPEAEGRLPEADHGPVHLLDYQSVLEESLRQGSRELLEGPRRKRGRVKRVLRLFIKPMLAAMAVTAAAVVAGAGMLYAAAQWKESLIPKVGDVRLFSGIEFVWCPPGVFMMGSAKGEEGRQPGEERHEVTLTKGFWMGRYEVTQEQWQKVMGKNPAFFKASLYLPVERISWKDAQAFIARLNAARGDGLRLPTETEWEYACRAGSTAPFSFGKRITSNEANYNGEYSYGDGPKSKRRGKTLMTGFFAPNAWGLYDMHGNVKEWCQDWYDAYFRGPITDPLGPRTGTIRVVRGGGCFNQPWVCRSANRQAYAPDRREESLGFRLCRSER